MKGTHMSRCLEVLQAHVGELGTVALPGLMRTILRRLEARTGTLSLRFEDLARHVALDLKCEPRVAACRVMSENFESIQNHSAYAAIEHNKLAA
jgi:GTP cyclohydrolase FolE2